MLSNSGYLDLTFEEFEVRVQQTLIFIFRDNSNNDSSKIVTRPRVKFPDKKRLLGNILLLSLLIHFTHDISRAVVKRGI